MESLWELEINNESTAQTISFIQEQASFLEKETNGKVMARFIKSRVTLLDEIQGTEKKLTRIMSGNSSEDASKLYSNQEYEFYVTDKNKKYELALFNLTCGDYYPIHLSIDSVIAYEINRQQEIDIETMSIFHNVYKQIIQANKTRCVIIKLSNLTE